MRDGGLKGGREDYYLTGGCDEVFSLQKAKNQL